MEILPSEYQHIELSRNEKIFVRNVMSNEQYGYLLLGTNPAMLPNESMHILVCSDGILFLKFFEGFEDATKFGIIMPMMINGLYNKTAKIIASKLLANKALIDTNEQLKFAVNIVYVFPALKRGDVNGAGDADLQKFTLHHCWFKEDLQSVRSGLAELQASYLMTSFIGISPDRFHISDENVNSIFQRIAPEYVTVRMSTVVDEETKAGADNELLVVTENDATVKAFRLDADQINIVNKISKGDQLILACAGSGKSVLLIAKCFKAAMMNPDKQFLITCFNRNLYSLYTWFIDLAGLRARNVTCLTFHALCRKLLLDNGLSIYGLDADGFVDHAIDRLNRGLIQNRYYGIFIDEVQQFEPEWYKFCFNLLENKTSDDHLFVICGDKTQKLENLRRHGRAPWNAGEGYPTYRGANKNIRIERNYRNCIEINEYINNYVSNAKQYLFGVNPNMELDPDEFLRGKSVFHGKGVTLKHLEDRSNWGEAKAVLESIRKIHDEDGIPYDEIAVIMFNRSFKKRIPGWKDAMYRVEQTTINRLDNQDIPYCRMYNSDDGWGARYGDDGGVRFIGFRTVLGLDFRAAIVCGIASLGEFYGTKNPNWEQLKSDEESFQETIKNTEDEIRFLYVACTRAKEVLHIILPETGETSVYVKMLEDAE